MLVWVFVTLTLVGSGPAVRTTHGPYDDADTCDRARNTWMRELAGTILVLELGACETRRR